MRFRDAIRDLQAVLAADPRNAMAFSLLGDIYARQGRVDEALRLHRALLPLYTGIFRTQGTILVKAGLNVRGLPAGPVRSPLVDATEEQVAQLREDCAEAGLALP